MAVSKWRSIADDLAKRINEGRIPHGAQLPTELELQTEYDASRNTVRDAVKWLIQRQLVQAYPGRGTFVSPEITPFAVALSGDANAYVADARIQNRRPSMSEPRVEIRKATGAVARQLQLDEGARVVTRHQQRYIDDHPWTLQTSFYPMEFVNRGADRLVDAIKVDEGVGKYLEDSLGLSQSGYQDLISVRPLTPEETQFFGLPDNSSVMLIELSRTAYATTGEPIRFTVTVYPADRNLLYYNIGDIPEAAAVVSP